jgi:hypothetical protein
VVRDREDGFDADRYPSTRRRDRRADVFGGEDGKATGWGSVKKRIWWKF